MREKIVILTASILRKLPDFRGKFRIGMLMEKAFLNQGNGWKVDDVRLTLKSGNIMHLDPRSATHKAPFWTGRYDDAIISQFLSVFQKDWVVMDVGANIGYYTLSFARTLSALGGGKVIAVEPLPNNIEKLQQHIDLNSCRQLVNLVTVALGDKNGSIHIYATEKGKTGNAYIGEQPIEQVKEVSTHDIPIERLDDSMVKWGIQRCDFMKMDIEGAEILLLKGAPQFLEKFRPIIYGEFNSLFIEKFGYNFMDVAALLTKLDYKPYLKQGLKYEPVEPASGMVDVLWVPAHQTQYLKSKGLIS